MRQERPKGLALPLQVGVDGMLKWVSTGRRFELRTRDAGSHHGGELASDVGAGVGATGEDDSQSAEIEEEFSEIGASIRLRRH
jgi:hypothetical protein